MLLSRYSSYSSNSDNDRLAYFSRGQLDTLQEGLPSVLSRGPVRSG